jgi:TolB-like protein
VQPGARIAHFEILGLIGSGGMGEVYRARDPRLGRDVAIKVLPAEFASDPERLKRFEQEARAVAALNHPNILAIFDVGSAPLSSRAEGEESAVSREPVHYLVTELLEGESLRERLSSGPLPVRKAIELGVEIANGLAAAHEKGIIHRDLKPGNVFITKDGHVKILDFGLAKLTPSRTGAEQARATTVMDATEAGIVLGTVGYMSPEQIRGHAVDHRTDIFSFGCVLYEMLGGSPPFRRESTADMMAAILKEQPPALAPLRREIPSSLAEIVERCLEKASEERFQSARDLAYALGRTVAETRPVEPPALPVRSRRRLLLGLVAAAVLVVGAGALVVKLRLLAPKAAMAAVPKIVVLPFENLGLPEDAYFASGMAEEITSRLANVHGLGVISRTSAIQYNQKGKTVKQIGSDLGVDYVLEGSVRFDHGQGKEGRVRITPQLIRVADDTHVWADRYDRVLADVFAIQSEVAESTVKAMGVALLPPEQTKLKEISTNNLEAYDLYLRGLELVGRGETCEMLGAALEKFEAAVDRDPRFAQALAMGGSIHLAMYWIECEHGQEHLARGKEMAERAIELRPDLAETHLALGDYFFRGLKDSPRALAEYAIAARIQPSNAWGFMETGFALRFQQKLVEASAVWEKGLELDPRNVHLLHHLAVNYVWAGRYADADRALGRVIALSPQWSWSYAIRARLQVQWHGDVDRAQAILDEASHIAGINSTFPNARRWLALLRRDYPEVLRLLAEAERQASNDPDELARLSLARGQAQMLAGQPDLARRSYEAARAELEKKIAQEPNDADSHSSLGVAYGGLGRRADAVREAKLGCDLMPVSNTLNDADGRLEDLARVDAMVGQPGEAIAILDDVLSRAGDYTTHVLRLDPAWDPLRSDPRFQALLKKHEIKE